jgi:NAD(P)-dependent dehydrogenase (short-subunit alcohol dehydrogenase family)
VTVNKAGIYRERRSKDLLGQIDYREWQDPFAVNTRGAVRISEALIENQTRGVGRRDAP